MYKRQKVTRIVDFGAFVAIGGGKEGLVHISQIADKRVEKVTDYLPVSYTHLLQILRPVSVHQIPAVFAFFTQTE